MSPELHALNLELKVHVQFLLLECYIYTVSLGNKHILRCVIQL